MNEDGEILLKVNSTTNEIVDAADIDPEMGCVEMALNGDAIEGPFLQLCDFEEGSLDDGYVKKCCPVGQVIDPDKKACVSRSEAVHR